MSFLRLATRAIATPQLTRSAPRIHQHQHIQRVRFYGAAAGLSRDVIQSRVFEVLKGHEKVDPDKLHPAASFTSDLGLDSLDVVEVVMAVEEEFDIEIPDLEADDITTVQQAIDYIEKTPEAH